MYNDHESDLKIKVWILDLMYILLIKTFFENKAASDLISCFNTKLFCKGE